MAKVRFIGHEPHTVPELGDREVQPDELITVPDDRFEAYVCQTSLWESVEEPAADAAPAKKTSPAKGATTKGGA